MRTTRFTLPLLTIAMLLCAPARAAEPAFVRHLGPEHKQALAINDPLPHLQRMLNSPSLRKALLDGRLGAAIRRIDPTANPDPALAWTFVQQNQRWVPGEVTVGVDDAAVRSVDSTFKLVVLSLVGRGAQTLKDKDDVAKAMAKVEADALAELRRIEPPGLRVIVRMRNGEDAAALVGMAGLQLKQMPVPPAVKLAVGEKRITGTVSLGDFFDDGTVQGMLEAGGLARADSPVVKDMSRIVRGWRVEASLEAVGDAMVLTIGKVGSAGAPAAPLKIADLGPLFRWDAGDVVWSRWDVTALGDGWFGGWAKVWEQWKDTDAGQAASEEDDDDLLGTLERFGREMSIWGLAGELRLWVEQASGALRMETRERGGLAEAPDVASGPVAKAIAAKAEAFEVLSTAGLGELVVGLKQGFEDQLDAQIARADNGGHEEWSAVLDAIQSGYDEHFDAFAKVIDEKAAAAFEPGVAWVIGTRGSVPKFELTVEGKDGKRRAFAGKDLPMLELAVVGRPKDAKAADALVREAYAALAWGARSAAGLKDQKQKPEAPDPVTDADLGLGRPTRAFSGAFIEDVARAAGGGAKVTFTLTGDLRPHYFDLDGLIVFSTSARLSREIVDAAGGKSPSIEPPKVDGRLVTFGRFPGRVLAQYAHHGAAWAELFLKDVKDGATIVEVIHGVGDLADLIGDSTWQVVQKGDVQTTTGVVPFK